MSEKVTRPVSIVCLTKYKEVFDPFFESLEKFDPGSDTTSGSPLIIVKDDSPILNKQFQGNRFFLLAGEYNRKIKVIDGPPKFSMSGNGNIGLKAVPKDHDVVYLGDDTRFVHEKTIETLQEVAYSDESIGILSAKLVGRGSQAQTNPSELDYIKPLEMWFPCVYIKRELIDKIGYLDERFNDFGCDDFDYCIRTLLAGYKLAVTNKVSVQHGSSPEGGPTTFIKVLGVDTYRKQENAAQKKVMEKYNLSATTFRNFLTSGDISLLKTKDPTPEAPTQPTKTINVDNTGDKMLCTQENAREFLKTQHLFIGSPCYGGWASINYMQSLLGLINICHDMGIKYTVSFMHNESLITRARNRLCSEFLSSGATQLLWIDADLGYDPKDIISLMMYEADIIGIPCSRKNLRLDRIVQAVKKNGKEYTIEELENILGEFVVNFPYGKVPDAINLGRLIEVMEVGTGIMRIHRSVFERFIEAYPELRYLQMSGEDGGRIPMHLFFQAEIDEDSKQYNPESLGDYISEDYSFCRRCRKAGMKVYLAPWAISSHMGSMFFKANLPAVAKIGGSLR